MDAQPLLSKTPQPSVLGKPAIALYWNHPIEGPTGGPNPYGSCWFVAQGNDWPQTHQRLMTCIEQAHNPLAMPRPTHDNDELNLHVA